MSGSVCMDQSDVTDLRLVERRWRRLVNLFKWTSPASVIQV